jgi:arylsulfatase A-like enzyme
VFNLNAPVVWSYRREWHGVMLPGVLWERTLLLQNAGILLASLAVFVALALLLVRYARASPMDRAWRGVGHPAVVIALLSVAGGAALGAHVRRVAGPDRPNVILISIDTLRADHLGCYGYERPTSPVIDSLATRGVRFEWAFAQATFTLPSHMTLFTSLYPTVHDVINRDRRLPGERTTVTEALQEAGYRTAAFTDGGFVGGRYGFNQGFERYRDRWTLIAGAVPRALDWVSKIPRREPFFLFLHCYDVHDPYLPPSPYREMFTDPAYDGGFVPTTGALSRIRDRLAEDPDATHDLTDDDVAHMVALYDGGIRYTDGWLGRFFAGLRRAGVADDTWIILTSDHGEEFTEHGSVLHERLYHTVTHVPLLVVPPGGLERPVVRSEIVELLDVAPTLTEIAGAPAIRDAQGASLVSLLGPPAVPGEVDPEWENLAHGESNAYGKEISLTTRDLHVLDTPEREKIRGFAYLEDRLEQDPIGEEDRRWEVVRELARAMYAWKDRQVAVRGGSRSEARTLSREEEERLRGLGYIQ